MLFSCGNKDLKDTAEPYVKPVDFTLRILDIMNGVKPNVSCLSADSNIPSSGNTNSEGDVLLRIAGNSQYTITTTASGYMDHNVTGLSGTEDFTAVSLMASRDLTDQIYGMLNIDVDPSKGVLIVAIDDPELRPAIGASASTNLNNDGAFVFGATSVEWSDTIPSGGSGFVAFPNIESGDAQITITAPENQNCWFSPGGTPDSTTTASAQITEDQVTVVLFTCDVLE